MNEENKKEKIKLPYEAPYNYFESLEDKLMQTIAESEEIKTNSPWWSSLGFSAKKIAIICGLTLLLLGTWTIIKQNKKNLDSAEMQLASLEEEEILNYLALNSDQFELEESDIALLNSEVGKLNELNLDEDEEAILEELLESDNLENLIEL